MSDTIKTILLVWGTGALGFFLGAWWASIPRIVIHSCEHVCPHGHSDWDDCPVCGH
jgi:hypothetical protein